MQPQPYVLNAIVYPLCLMCDILTTHTHAPLQMSIIFIAPPAQFECANATIERCSAACPAHEFNRSVFTETIITQWDLVCDNAQLANVSQMMFMLGILLGNVLFGTIADK